MASGMAGVLEDQIAATIRPILVSTMEKIMPQVQAQAMKLAESAEPMIRRVVVEEVVPRTSAAIFGSVVTGALIGALVGSWFATK